MEVDLTHRRFRRILGEAGFRIVQSRPIGAWIYRGRIAAGVGSNPERERKLERIFSSGIWAHIAPDTVILAQKVRSIA